MFSSSQLARNLTESSQNHLVVDVVILQIHQTQLVGGSPAKNMCTVIYMPSPKLTNCPKKYGWLEYILVSFLEFGFFSPAFLI